MPKWMILFVFFAIAGCATSLPRTFDSIKPGQDKDQVLGAVGNPQHSFRLNGEDHWQYVYQQDDDDFRRDVIFHDGKVSRVTTPLRKSEWTKQLEDSDTLEEYEAKVRQHQKESHP